MVKAYKKKLLTVTLWVLPLNKITKVEIVKQL